MKVNVEKIENNVATLKIEVGADEFEKALEQAYKKNVKRFNIPGFRRGKAPRRLIEMHYGPEVFYEDAAEIVLSEAYKKGVEENNLEPVDHPHFDIDQIEKGKGIVATAKVTVKPEVDLGEYKGLEVEKMVYNVTEEDVEKELKALQEKNARLISVERAAQKGDIVIVDLEGFLDGKPLKDGKVQNYPMELGSKILVEDLEEQIAGMNAGETREVKVTYPADHPNKELAGKEVLFKVTLKEIKEKELPVIDDEFAKDVSEFDTLQELKQDIKNKLEERAKSFAESSLRGSILKKLTEQAKVDIPQAMIDREIERLIMDFAFQLRLRGMDLKEYLEASQLSPEEFKAKFQDRAYENVKTSLVLEAVAKAENIEVSEEELDDELSKYAEAAQKSLAEYKKGLKEENLEYIKDRILTRKIFDFLKSHAKVTEKVVEGIAGNEGEGEEEQV
ncbi:trigger factor [Thermosediminibacter oceani]|uniref:Trigger factor n=1 Tax=Thermosediminibacter oceani (strain ATCC BAA-1034 / DSM 16646 / JW/IW-1228P) TaxID=555079 RepID=D9RYS8_THEOJ|nr:trigger factor [Thermosediminibacter oceani]ADL08502.1 trigger factor [Thermosediminibacter oceani DSM 16646]